MKILVLSDVHGTTTGIMTTLELCQRYEPDLTIICGDITQFGPHTWAEGYLKRISGRKAVVPGNCDPKNLDEVIERSGGINLHRRRETIEGMTFVGAGGADYTPFNTIFEFGDDTFTKWLESLMQENAILVTHAPAHGILDTDHAGNPRGSRSIRRIVDRWRPMLMLSGHMHEARGVVEHSGTVFVNPGPAKDGFGALVELVPPGMLHDEREEVGKSDEAVMWNRVRESVEVKLVRA